MRPELHTYFRAMLAGMAFCVALIMTPRVWVEAPASERNPEVPVNQLQNGDDCIWCRGDTPDTDCNEYERYFLFDSATSNDDCDDRESGPHA